jgi:hypothetical protein
MVDQLRVFVRAGAIEDTSVPAEEVPMSSTAAEDDYPSDVELADVEWVEDDYPSDVEI